MAKAGVIVGAQSKQDAAASDRSARLTGAQLQPPPIMRIYLLQFIVLVMVSLLLLAVDTTTALSAFCGGVIAVGPNAYFARWAFRFSGAKSAASVARSFYRGEAGKFVLTTVLFACVFMLLRPINAIALFLLYIAMMALNWILAVRCINQ